MASSLLFSVAGGLVTTVLAAFWAALVGEGLDGASKSRIGEGCRDIRTW